MIKTHSDVICAEFLRGRTLTAIAADFRCSRECIRRIVRHAGHTPSQGGWKKRTELNRTLVRPIAHWTQEDVRAKFHYAPETGQFTRDGRPVGYPIAKGYIVVCYANGKRIQAHRLAWLYVHGRLPGPGEVDHANRITSDNRLENLRLATQSQQHANRRGRSRKGYPKGVQPSGRGWMASYEHSGRYVYLGTFDTSEAASTAYAQRMTELYGEFACA